jgi:hypothetical protein
VFSWNKSFGASDLKFKSNLLQDKHNRMHESLLQDKHKRTHNSFVFSTIFSLVLRVSHKHQTLDLFSSSSMKVTEGEKQP